MNVTFFGFAGGLVTVPIEDVLSVKQIHVSTGHRGRNSWATCILIRNGGASPLECLVDCRVELVKWHIQQVAKRHGIPLRLPLVRIP